MIYFKENILTEDKIYKTVQKINKKIKKILIDNPEFTGDIHLSFFMGGLATINKKECMEIK